MPGPKRRFRKSWPRPDRGTRAGRHLALRAARPARALLIQALFSFGLWGVTATVMNLYLHRAGLSNDVIAYANAMPALAALLIGLPVASASDRYGRRPFLVFGPAPHKAPDHGARHRADRPSG